MNSKETLYFKKLSNNMVLLIKITIMKLVKNKIIIYDFNVFSNLPFSYLRNLKYVENKYVLRIFTKKLINVYCKYTSFVIVF